MQRKSKGLLWAAVVSGSVDTLRTWPFVQVLDAIGEGISENMPWLGRQLAMIEWPDGLFWGFALGIATAVAVMNIDFGEWRRRYFGSPVERTISKNTMAGLNALRNVEIKLAHQAIENLVQTMLHNTKTRDNQQSIHSFNVAHHCLTEMQNWAALKLDIALGLDQRRPTYKTVAGALDAYIAAYYRLQEVALPHRR